MCSDWNQGGGPGVGIPVTVQVEGVCRCIPVGLVKALAPVPRVQETLCLLRDRQHICISDKFPGSTGTATAPPGTSL